MQQCLAVLACSFKTPSFATQDVAHLAATGWGARLEQLRLTDGVEVGGSGGDAGGDCRREVLRYRAQQPVGARTMRVEQLPRIVQHRPYASTRDPTFCPRELIFSKNEYPFKRQGRAMSRLSASVPGS